jgi:HD-like signal output (HDOD) protein
MLESCNHHNPHLEQIQTYIARLPSLSTTAAKVMEICNNPEASPNDLNRVISMDLVLTGQVLKLTNSAYYSLRHPISSLTRAIVMLGINTVKNLVLSVAILEQMCAKQSFPALFVEDFWTHSLCVRVTAKYLSAAKGVPLSDQEEFFVGGLLHDLGKIPLNYQFPEKYFQALEMAKRTQRPLFHSEGVVFGFDHGAIGGLISKKWQLGSALIEALCFHHRPDDARENNHQLVFIVALADIFAQLLHTGSGDKMLVNNSLCGYLLERVDVNWSFLYGLRDTVLSEISKAKIFLEIAEKREAR